MEIFMWLLSDVLLIWNTCSSCNSLHLLVFRYNYRKSFSLYLNMLTTEQIFYFKTKYQMWALQWSLLDWYISALCMRSVIMMSTAKDFCPECILFQDIPSSDTEKFGRVFGFFLPNFIFIRHGTGLMLILL